MPMRLGRDPWDGQRKRVHWEGSKITRVEVVEDSPDPVDLPWIAPGFMDIQVNGFAGIHFGSADLSPEQVREVSLTLARTGVAQYLPTLITDAAGRMAEALARLALAMRDPEIASALPGIHMEGPYLSAEDGPRGAHPLEHCKDPTWEEFCRFQDAADGKILLVTLAPERAGAPEFIRRLVKSGVRVAIGHTAADRDSILRAVDAGATLSTHLGNAAHDLLQRHRNYLYDQLAEDRLSASLIVDGHHLPPHLVNIFWRVKGPNRTILVSDAVQYAGLSPGVYDAGYRQFEVRADGFIGVVGEPRMAGSGLLLANGIENLVRFTACSLADAIGTVTCNPARFLGLEGRFGELKSGGDASLILFRWEENGHRLTPLETVCSGQTVFCA